MIVIIPCGGKKRLEMSRARDLYIGPYFKACLRYSLYLVEPERVYILSALHGLLILDEEVEPYDLRMGQPGCVRVDQIRHRATEFELLNEEVIALGGREYTGRCLQVWPHALTPLEGVGGIGKQLAWLKSHCR